MDFARFQCELPLCIQVELLRLTQAQEMIGEAQDDQARIGDDRQQHLRSVSAWVADSFCWGSPLGWKTDTAELTQLASETHCLGAKAARSSLLIDQACIEQGHGKRSEHDVIVDRESCDRSRECQRAHARLICAVLGRKRGELRLGRKHRGGGWSQGGSRCFHD